MFKISKATAIFLIIFCALFAQSVSAQVDVLDSLIVDEINLIKFDLADLEVYTLSRISVADPQVVHLQQVQEDRVVLIGQSAGQSPIFIWDEHGKRVIMVYVYNQDLDMVKARIKRLLKTADIRNITLDKNEHEGKIVISGEVPEYQQSLFEDVISQFDDMVITLTQEEEIEDLVHIDLQITEINLSFSKTLGVDWTIGGSIVNPIYAEDAPSPADHIQSFAVLSAKSSITS